MGRGFPSPRKNAKPIAQRLDSPARGASAPHAHEPVDSASQPFRGPCEALSPRPTGRRQRTPEVAIRGAQRRGGGVRGGVSPPREKTRSKSRSDLGRYPVGEVPRALTNPSIRRHNHSRARAGRFHHGVSKAPMKADVHAQRAILVPREDPGDGAARGVLDHDDGFLGVRQARGVADVEIPGHPACRA